MGSAAIDRTLTLEEITRQRAAVVAEAEKWLRTPFHHGARVRGGGVDCVNLVCASYEGSGVVERLELPAYSPDWMVHSDDLRFIDGLLNYCVEIQEPPKPGDIAVWRFGRAFAHGAIVVRWPLIVHAFLMDPVSYADASADLRLLWVGENTPEKNLPRPRRFFQLKAWHEAGG